MLLARLGNTMGFELTAQHHAIFNFVRHGSGHGVVLATAGAGKTTTLLEIAKRLPNDLKIAFVAFAKHTVLELRSKLPAHVKAMTLHSNGLENLTRCRRPKSSNQQVPFAGHPRRAHQPS
jgi:superfamily II DNA or RNA helicase